MGRYLNVDLKGDLIRTRNKFMALINSGAEMIETPGSFDQFKEEGKGIICVVDNGPFQAAAYAYSQSELDAFKYPCGRPKAFLKADIDLIEKYAN
jgi:hypothetical protein